MCVLRSEEHSARSALKIISDEIMKIAEEIESLPSLTDGEITNEDMMRMQKIDFCSQKLNDLANIVSHVSSTEDVEAMNADLELEMEEIAKLEYIRERFRKAG